MTLLEARGLHIAIGGKTVCEDLHLKIEAGQTWGILGQNGIGKTTLLLTLAGLRPPGRGEVLIEGRPLSRLHSRETARRIGVVPQDNRELFPSSVLETALIGRHPYLKRWQWEDQADLDKARAALRVMELEDMAQREVGTLSGGEHQRLQIATLLTQAPALSLLDEPINHLDLRHQIHTLETLRRLCSGPGHALVMVLHDVNLAARYCDHLLLVCGDGVVRVGHRDEVLTLDNLNALYGYPLRQVELEGRRFFLPE